MTVTWSLWDRGGAHSSTLWLWALPFSPVWQHEGFLEWEVWDEGGRELKKREEEEGGRRRAVRGRGSRERKVELVRPLHRTRGPHMHAELHKVYIPATTELIKFVWSADDGPGYLLWGCAVNTSTWRGVRRPLPVHSYADTFMGHTEWSPLAPSPPPLLLSPCSIAITIDRF